MNWGSAVIFAGGKSSRMGKDKALLPFGDFDTLAEYQHSRLSKWFDHVYISAKENKFPFDAQIIYDKHLQSSPMIALSSSLRAVSGDEIFIMSVDMPFVDEKLFESLFQHYKRDNAEIAIASSISGIEPLCGIYSTNILSKTELLIEEEKHRMREILNICNTTYVECSRDDVFANLNTPDEYLKYNNENNSFF